MTSASSVPSLERTRDIGVQTLRPAHYSLGSDNSSHRAGKGGATAVMELQHVDARVAHSRILTIRLRDVF